MSRYTKRSKLHKPMILCWKLIWLKMSLPENIAIQDQLAGTTSFGAGRGRKVMSRPCISLLPVYKLRSGKTLVIWWCAESMIWLDFSRESHHWVTIGESFWICFYFCWGSQIANPSQIWPKYGQSDITIRRMLGGIVSEGYSFRWVHYLSWARWKDGVTDVSGVQLREMQAVWCGWRWRSRIIQAASLW